MNRFPHLLKVLQALSLTSVLVLSTAPMALADQATLYVQQGPVKVKRNGWLWFRTAANGMRLGSADLIQVTGRGRASLQCPGQSSPTPLPNGTSSVNSRCNLSVVINRPFEPLEAGDLRGGSDSTLPYVITPRTGAVLDATPLIRWNLVEGVTQYTVKIEARRRNTQVEPEAIVWQTQTSNPQIQYPGTPLLEPGTFYTVVVETNTGQSSAAEKSDRTSFVFMPPSSALNDQLAAIDREQLPVELAAIEKAKLYQEQEYFTTALNTLEAAAKEDETVRLWRQLGNLYLTTGLRHLAETAYTHALASIHLFEDLEEQTLTHLGLGVLYASVMETDSAIQHFRQAQLGAYYVCDTELLKQIQEQLIALTGEEANDSEVSCFPPNTEAGPGHSQGAVPPGQPGGSARQSDPKFAHISL